MLKQERVQKIMAILDCYFPAPEIPLIHTSAYTLLIAVLLSAQCTDLRVNLVTPALFQRADSPEKMVQLTAEEIEAFIKTCGLSKQKSVAIKKLSEILLEKHGGEVPDNFEDLEALPGVGHKTASVVMIQAFNKSAFPVDTHIHRCAKRWGLSHASSVKETERDLKELFPEKCWSKLHLQMIYFARTFCTAKGHTVEECPICSVLR